MPNDQQGSILSDEEKIKRRWKQDTENPYRKDKRMTETFEEDSVRKNL